MINKYFNNKIIFSILLSLTAGFLNTYSYILRGNVFTTGQTGNLIYMSMYLSRGMHYETFMYLFPIISFWLGTLFVNLLIKVKGNQFTAYTVIIFSIIAYFIIGFVPASFPHIYINVLLTFSTAMHYREFKDADNNIPYASIFCTGNMRSCADALFKWIWDKDKSAKRSCIIYFSLLLAFVLGVAAGVFSTDIAGVKASWLACLFVFAAFWFRKKDD